MNILVNSAKEQVSIADSKRAILLCVLERVRLVEYCTGESDVLK